MPKSVLEFPEVTTVASTDYLYTIRGSGPDRDKKVKAGAMMVTFAPVTLVDDLSVALETYLGEVLAPVTITVSGKRITYTGKLPDGKLLRVVNSGSHALLVRTTNGVVLNYTLLPRESLEIWWTAGDPVPYWNIRTGIDATGNTKTRGQFISQQMISALAPDAYAMVDADGMIKRGSAPIPNGRYAGIGTFVGDLPADWTSRLLSFTYTIGATTLTLIPAGTGFTPAIGDWMDIAPSTSDAGDLLTLAWPAGVAVDGITGPSSRVLNAVNKATSRPLFRLTYVSEGTWKLGGFDDGLKDRFFVETDAQMLAALADTRSAYKEIIVGSFIGFTGITGYIPIAGTSTIRNNGASIQIPAGVLGFTGANAYLYFETEKSNSLFFNGTATFSVPSSCGLYITCAYFAGVRTFSGSGVTTIEEIQLSGVGGVAGNVQQDWWKNTAQAFGQFNVNNEYQLRIALSSAYENKEINVVSPITLSSTALSCVNYSRIFGQAVTFPAGLTSITQSGAGATQLTEWLNKRITLEGTTITRTFGGVHRTRKLVTIAGIHVITGAGALLYELMESGIAPTGSSQAWFDNTALAAKSSIPKNKSVTVELPVSGENITIWTAKTACTMMSWDAILTSTAGSPSLTWTLGYCTTRTAALTTIIASTTTTTTTTKQNGTTFTNDSIPAGAMVVLKTTAIVATVTSFNLTLNFNEEVG